MPKCPSKFCDHINPNGANYCGMCATDLNLSEKEIENRDTLYELFREVFKKVGKYEDFDRAAMNYLIEKHGATIAMFMLEIGKSYEKEKDEKIEYPKKGLYSIFLKRLKELKPDKSGIIRFPKVFEKLCSSFQITKKQCWDILFMFRDFGLIEIVRGQGVRILKEK